MCKNLVISVILCISNLVQGICQDTLVIFDQPGYTTSPYIVKPGTLQFEFGTGYNETTGLNETFFPSLLTRIPLGNRAEFRVTINYEPQSNSFILDDVGNNHDPIALGFKQKLAYQNGWMPHLAVMGNVFYPVQRFNQPFLLQELCADAWLLAEHDFERHQLIYCTGYLRGNERLRDIYSWAICYGYMITERICLFGEYFGFHYVETGFTEHALDAGMTWEFGNLFQLDLCYYYNMDPNQKMGYLTGGIAYNCALKNRKSR